MSSSIEQLIRRPVSFLDDSGPSDEIAVSTRIRLARNLASRPFPAASSPEEAQELCRIAVDGAVHSGAFGKDGECRIFYPAEMTQLDREILLERRLASRELIASPENTALLVCPHERCSLMVNEEDQLRIQAIRPGFQLDAVWEEINAIDDKLSAEFDYAFDDKLGYLTGSPTDVGTGMRASVMLHLPGLVLTEQIAPTIQGINKLHLAVRGIFGEGSENLGSLFQISNQSTLGESESKIIADLTTVIDQLIAYEKNARFRLLEDDRFRLLDHVGRAYGVLRHSYLLSGAEALKSLSGVRIGVDLGLFSTLDVRRINELFIAAGPAHLQKMAGKLLNDEERRIRRAAIFREKLKQIAPDR